MINKTILVGRITRDPELQSTSSGIAYTRFSLAVNRAFTNSQGDREADFINCVAWRRQAENLCKFIRKGGQIGVDGRIQTGSYEDQDGNVRYTTDVVADAIHFLEPKGTSSSDYNQSAGIQQSGIQQNSFSQNTQKPAQQNNVQPKNDPFFDEDLSKSVGMDIEDDLPF